MASVSRPDGTQVKKEKEYKKRVGNMEKRKREEWS